jgi:hypothetical protein
MQTTNPPSKSPAVGFNPGRSEKVRHPTIWQRETNNRVEQRSVDEVVQR